MHQGHGAPAVDNAAPLLPLAVDLDGTLLATDTLHEGLVAALVRDPASVPGLLMSLLQGRFEQWRSGKAANTDESSPKPFPVGV